MDDPKDLQRYAIVGRALARAIVDMPEDILKAYADGRRDNGAGLIARAIVRELKHAGFALKDADKKPWLPQDPDAIMAAPERRINLEDYVQMALDIASVGTRVTLYSYDRRNQRLALNRLTEAICNSFRANRVTLERSRPPDWRG